MSTRLCASVTERVNGLCCQTTASSLVTIQILSKGAETHIYFLYSLVLSISLTQDSDKIKMQF